MVPSTKTQSSSKRLLDCSKTVKASGFGRKILLYPVLLPSCCNACSPEWSGSRPGRDASGDCGQCVQAFMDPCGSRPIEQFAGFQHGVHDDGQFARDGDGDGDSPEAEPFAKL